MANLKDKMKTVILVIVSFFAGLAIAILINVASAALSSIVLQSNGYINFGGTAGTGGYGIYDSGGTLQFKNSGGSWTAIGSGSGGGNQIKLSSTVISSATSSITIAVPSGYKQLNLRISDLGVSGGTPLMRFNSDTGANYWYNANPSTSLNLTNGVGVLYFNANIIINNYPGYTKMGEVDSSSGSNNSNDVQIQWSGTAEISSITIIVGATAGVIDLYGVSDQLPGVLSTVNASNVNAGTFGAGAFTFPAAVNVGTTLTASTLVGSLNASNLSSGTFGVGTGNGNYTFPAGGQVILGSNSGAPSTPVAGGMYYDTGTSKARVYQGGSWSDIGGSSGGGGSSVNNLSVYKSDGTTFLGRLAYFDYGNYAGSGCSNWAYFDQANGGIHAMQNYECASSVPSNTIYYSGSGCTGTQYLGLVKSTPVTDGVYIVVSGSSVGSVSYASYRYDGVCTTQSNSISGYLTVPATPFCGATGACIIKAGTSTGDLKVYKSNGTTLLGPLAYSSVGNNGGNGCSNWAYLDQTNGGIHAMDPSSSGDCYDYIPKYTVFFTGANCASGAFSLYPAGNPRFTDGTYSYMPSTSIGCLPSYSYSSSRTNGVCTNTGGSTACNYAACCSFLTTYTPLCGATGACIVK